MAAAPDKQDVIPLAEHPVQRVFKEKALRSLSQLPPFSPILNRVMASLASEDASFAKLGDLIEKDTVLAGNLLHVVNSALYARRGTINSVRHALSILGVEKLRNAVLGMSISRMWSKIQMPSSWSMARFNMHSAACAILSDLLAQQLPVAYPEGAFVGGLLHDVGRLLIALSLPDEHDRIQRAHEQGGRTRLECEQALLGFTHPQLSADALAFWNLPKPIQTAVLYHHDPFGQAADSLSRVVDAANQYVNSLGVSILDDNGPESADGRVVESLGLDEDRVELVVAEFKAEYDTMAQFFR